MVGCGVCSTYVVGEQITIGDSEMFCTSCGAKIVIRKGVVKKRYEGKEYVKRD